MPSEDVLARLEALEARVRARDAEIERLKRSPEAAPREPTAQELMLRQRAENRRSLSFFPQAQDRIQTLHNAMTGLSIPFARKATALSWLRFGRWPDARRLTPEQATLLRSDARRFQNAGNVPAERSGVEWPPRRPLAEVVAQLEREAQVLEEAVAQLEAVYPAVIERMGGYIAQALRERWDAKRQQAQARE